MWASSASVLLRAGLSGGAYIPMPKWHASWGGVHVQSLSQGWKELGGVAGMGADLNSICFLGPSMQLFDMGLEGLQQHLTSPSPYALGVQMPKCLLADVCMCIFGG